MNEHNPQQDEFYNKEIWKEKYKRELLEYELNYNTYIQNKIEMFRSVMTAAYFTVKSVILINGGAAVAILAFMGSQAQHGSSVQKFQWVLICFSFGVLLGAMASGGTYLAQRKYALETDKTIQTKNYFTFITFVLVILSYLSFGLGCWSAANAFS